MKLYSKLLKVSIILCVIIISFLIILEWKIDRLLFDSINGHRAFYINLLIGIFTGSIISIITNFIGLKSEQNHFKHKEHILAYNIYNEIVTSKMLLEIIENNVERGQIFGNLANSAMSKEKELEELLQGISKNTKKENICITLKIYGRINAACSKAIYSITKDNNPLIQKNQNEYVNNVLLSWNKDINIELEKLISYISN